MGNSVDPSVRAIVERAVSSRTRRPLSLAGRSASGKTTLLREALASRAGDARWTTARDLVDEVVEALRSDRFDAYRQAFASDPQPLVVEHVEDLGGKTLTMDELRRLVDGRVLQGHPVILTLTVDRGTDGVLEWLRRFTRVIRLSATTFPPSRP